MFTIHVVSPAASDHVNTGCSGAAALCVGEIAVIALACAGSTNAPTAPTATSTAPIVRRRAKRCLGRGVLAVRRIR